MLVLNCLVLYLLINKHSASITHCYKLLDIKAFDKYM